MVEDRGDPGSTSSRPSPTGSSPLGSTSQRPASRGCSPASAPTRPGSTSTSTATRPSSMGVSIAELFNTLQVYLGSLYVNDFNRFGRTWQVNVQADADFRKQIDDLSSCKVRNDARGHGPAGHRRRDPRRQRPGDDHPLQHVPRRRRSTATPAPGVSSGQAIEAMETLVEPGTAPVDAVRMDRAGPAAARRPATPPCSSSPWPSCWSSWCWPPSTRAGRCRWR